MNISTKYRMLNKLKIKHCNVTYNLVLLGASVIVVVVFVVLQW